MQEGLGYWIDSFSILLFSNIKMNTDLWLSCFKTLENNPPTIAELL